MALTNDEIKEILELYGRGYSGRKIAKKTEHSEVTIYYYIRQAKKSVISLINKGMNADRISSQLDYPDLFVNRVIRESSASHEENEKDELEAEDTAEEIEPINKLDVRAEWDKFQKDLDIEQCTDHMRERAKEFMENLKLWEEHFRQRIVLDVEWERRQKAIESKLADFVLDRIEEINSMEALFDLESISEEIYGNINALVDEYKTKADQAEEARIAQDKAREEARIAQDKAREEALSDELLKRKINIPMFPDFVKEGVRRKFLVGNFHEASIIRDALYQINLEIMQAYGYSLDHNEEVWQAFMDKINNGGGDYMKKLASTYEQDTVNSLISINVCPSCESKLIRQYIKGRTFANCSSCSKSYEILKK